MEIESLGTEEKNNRQIKNIKKRIQSIDINAFVLFARGRSMWPTLLKGDVLYFKKIKAGDEIVPGDIVCYLNNDSKMICHRIVKNENKYLRTIGDSAYFYGPVEIDGCDKIKVEDIIGILVFIKRKGQIIDSFPNNNLNSTKATKIKYKIYNWAIRNNYRKEKFVKFNITLRLMLIKNRHLFKKNIENINLDKYLFSTEYIGENNIKLAIYKNRTLLNTIYYKKTNNMAYIYKVSVRMRNFGNGMEFIGIKYLKNSGMEIFIDKTSKNYINKYFESGVLDVK